MKQDLNRRSFLTGILAVGAVAAGGALTGCVDNSGTPGEVFPEWQKEADVIVVGSGFAGLSAAITAIDEGSSVILVEKAPEKDAGGNSRVCAQAVWTPSEIQAAIRYFKEITTEYHMQDIPEAMVEAYINEASKNATWLTEVAGIPMLIADSIEYPNAPSAPDARKKSMAISTEGLGNSRVWKAMKSTVDGRDIEMLFETPMTDLVFNKDGEVIGIKAESNGQEIFLGAHKAVILCPGGFEGDKIMNANYLRYPALSWGTPYNTGDVHKICMAYDIAFWHMNSATPATRIGMIMPTLGEKFKHTSFDIELPSVIGNHLWVDKYGKRFMNETSDYMHGYGRDEIFYNDGMAMEWPRLPFWQIMDQTVANYLGGRGALTSGWLEVVEGVAPSANFEKEIAAGVIFKGNTVEELASKIGIDPAVLAKTVSNFNAIAAAGEDHDFDREARTMKPLVGPYYAAKAYPVMVNTNGGPRRNENGQILRNDGTPVPRLFSSGEFGSIWAWYYQGAGNVSECLSFGRITGRNAAALESWKESE
ncbi:MAG: FAD-dependent oxidoreductase [Coriobacteriia bacterium]|nr:FAD-dependent oxidoreductase [Coriobacteriia bacterium]